MVPDRSKSRIALFTALLIMAILPLAPAGAVETVGTVVAVRGEAFAVNQQEESRRLTLKSPIHRMDTLKTRQGRIQLMFQDTTLITLGQNSEMVIKEYLWRPDQEYGAMTTKVKEGTFRIMGGAITRTAPRNFKTETPSATIGIRGSMYAGMVKGDTLMIVFQGGHGIYVMNGQGYVNITRPGFGTRIKGAGLAPSKPKRFTSGDLDNIEGALEIRVHKGKKTARAAESQVPRKPEKKPPPAKAPPPGKGPGETTTIAENVTTTVSDNSQESTAGNVKPPTDEEPPPSDEEPPPPDEEPPPPDEEPPPPDEEPPPPDEEPPPPDEEPPPPDEEPPPPDEEPPPPDEEPPPPDEEPPPPDEEPPPPDEEPPPPDEEPPPPDEEPPPP
ncbi:MAG: hypothetical protein GY737_17485, partial [Desulfobacteraceae bacterium]|nr:hypothetical protein [Desulfobacteraceae bacterium]